MASSNTGNKSGNNIEMVISRLAGEVAYTSKRLCIRNSHSFVKSRIDIAAQAIEEALQFLEKDKEDASNLPGSQEIGEIDSESGC